MFPVFSYSVCALHLALQHAYRPNEPSRSGHSEGAGPYDQQPNWNVLATSLSLKLTRATITPVTVNKVK